MKAIALDMDGTILDHDGRFPVTLADTFAELKDKGFYIFFATGRTSHAILELTPDNCPLDGYVAASGMGIYVGKEKIDAASFDPDFVSRMIDAAREREIYYEIHTLENSSRTLLQDQVYAFSDFRREKPDTMKPFEHNFTEKAMGRDDQWVDEMPFGDVVKIFFFSTDVEKITRWYEYLESRKAHSDYSLYTTSVHNAELMLKGRDKATGIQILLDHYDLDFADVHAIGDSMNDLPMFKKAGRATAMKNADYDIQQSVDDVTEYTCDEDGLEKYLRETYLDA